MPDRARRLLSPLLWLALVTPAFALEPADLCVGNPCLVTKSFSVTEDVVLDFPPATDLRFQSSGRAVLAAGAHLTIRAATIRLARGSGAMALGPGTGLRLEATSGELRSDGRGVFSLREGESLLLSASADAVLDASIDVRSKGEGTTAGDVWIEAGGALTIAGKINASGDAGGSEPASGGRLGLIARGGALVTSARIFVRSNSGPGGEVEMHSAATTTVAGKLDLSARSAPGKGGDLRVVSVGDVLMNAAVRTRGRGETAPGSDEVADCGDGGDVAISSRGQVVFASLVDIRGGLNCAGGLVTVQAEQGFTLAAGSVVDSLTAGAVASGGQVEIYTLRGAGITLAGAVKLRAVHGGSLLAQAARGEIVVADGAELRADSSGGAMADPGLVGLAADCGLRVEDGALIDVRSADNVHVPDRGVVELSVEEDGGLEVAGIVRAAGSVRIWHIDGSLPQLTGAIQPDPVLESRSADPSAGP